MECLHITAIGIAGLFAAGCALAEEQVVIHDVERIAPTGNARIAEFLDRIPRLRLGELSDSAAKAMLASLAEGSRTFLRWRLGEPDGAAVVVDRDIDLLVAHWRRDWSRVAV